MNGEESGRPTGKTAGLLTFPATEAHRDQLCLFEDDQVKRDADLPKVDECAPPDGVHTPGPTVSAPAVVTEHGGMLVPNTDRPAPCRVATDDPDVWTEPRFYPYLVEICNECPFRQWCANEALKMHADGDYRLIGLWAGIDFVEGDRAGRYRRRIQKLEHIAATGGSAPRTRQSRRTRRSDAA